MAMCIPSTAGARACVCVVAAAGGLVGVVRMATAQPGSLSLAARAYAHVNASTDFQMQQFTIATWFLPTGPGERGGGTLISGGEQPGGGTFLCSWWMGWEFGSGHVIGLVVNSYNISGRFITSNAVLPMGQVAHAALTFDGTTLRLYINGVLDQSIAYGFTGVDYHGVPEVFIGAFQHDTGYTYNRFDGQIDDAAVWNRPLGAGEVAALASCAPVVSGPGLVAYYPFTDHQLADASGGGHNGAAIGAVAFGPPIAGRLGTCCPADFNRDGTVNSADFFDFLTAFFPGAPAADFNHDGSVNSQDFFDFLGAFFAGC